MSRARRQQVPGSRRRSWARLLLALAAGCSGVLLLGPGCGSGPGGAGGSGAGSSSEAGGGASATPTTSTTNSSGTTTSTGGAAPCYPGEIPEEVPDGWVEWTEYSCSCRFYVPGSFEVMPAPIVWQPCAPPLTPGAESCRQMQVDWTDSPAAVALNPSFDVNPDGSGVLFFRRVASRYLLDLAADVDGAVRWAMMRVRHPNQPAGWPDPGCYLIGEQLHDGKVIETVNGDDWKDSSSNNLHKGGIAGALDQLTPWLLAHFVDDKWAYSYYHSESLVVRVDTPTFEVVATPWAMTPETLVTKPSIDPENLHAAQIAVHGETVFYVTATLKQQGINVWDPIDGARPFLRWIDDYTRGAADLGTDGVDLVWTYGEGKAPNDDSYPEMSIMTAPYTSDPTTVTATQRRLRSAPYPSMGHNYVVGCGYAAHWLGDSTLVVRLSDGVSWIILGQWPDFHAGSPIGLTCEEVFISSKHNGHLNIDRYRLDQLGEPIAPD